MGRADTNILKKSWVEGKTCGRKKVHKQQGPPAGLRALLEKLIEEFGDINQETDTSGHPWTTDLGRSKK